MNIEVNNDKTTFVEAESDKLFIQTFCVMKI